VGGQTMIGPEFEFGLTAILDALATSAGNRSTEP
jgi:hypothetical protein